MVKMDFSSLTEKDIKQRYESLPKKLKEALDSEDLKGVVYSICTDHNLHDQEKILMLEQLTGLIILGFVSSEDLRGEITEHLELDHKTSTLIAQEIDKKIFSHYRPELEKVYQPLDKLFEQNKEVKMEKRISSNSEIETLLKTAFSYIEEVEKQIEGFRDTVKMESEKANYAIEGIGRGVGFFGAMGTSLKSRFAIGKEKGKLLKDLDLAEKELNTAEQKAPDAHIETQEGVFSIPMMKSILFRLRGIIHALAGELKRAESYFKDSLNYLEIPDTYYELALTYEDLKEPRKACQMYQKVIDLCESNDDLLITVRKDLQRLESKKIGNGWFVGSWKVFLALAGIAAFGFLGAVFGKDPNLIPGIIIFGGLAAIYWWRKRR